MDLFDKKISQQGSADIYQIDIIPITTI